MRDTGHRLGRCLAPVQRALERVEQHVADLAGIDQLVEARARRPTGTTPRAPCRAASLGLVGVGARARLIAAAPIAPIVAPGKANTADWLSNPIMPITIDPKP